MSKLPLPTFDDFPEPAPFSGLPLPDFAASAGASSPDSCKSSSKVKNIISDKEFSELFPDSPRNPVIAAVHSNKKMMPRNRTEYTIYTPSSLHQLVEIIRGKQEHTIRYLLTVDNRLLFAEEGPTPPHAIMPGTTDNLDSGRCISAGNLIFNNDFTQFNLISNKSGDFQPPFVSLKTVLAVLWILNKNKFVSLEGSLQILRYMGTGIRDTYVVSLETLSTFVMQAFDTETLNEFLEANKNTLQHMVAYEPPTQGQSRFNLNGSSSSNSASGDKRIHRRRGPLCLFQDDAPQSEEMPPTLLAYTLENKERDSQLDERLYDLFTRKRSVSHQDSPIKKQEFRAQEKQAKHEDCPETGALSYNH